jgi:hypothetical protein
MIVLLFLISVFYDECGVILDEPILLNTDDIRFAQSKANGSTIYLATL